VCLHTCALRVGENSAFPRSAISVHIIVFNTWNLNSVYHVLLRFRKVSTLCRKVSEIVPKVKLKLSR
jgi:hypothetical protein